MSKFSLDERFRIGLIFFVPLFIISLFYMKDGWLALKFLVAAIVSILYLNSKKYRKYVKSKEKQK